MKKFILLFFIIIVSGCSNNKERKLCNKLDEIDVSSFNQEQNYDELANILDNYYTTYCSNLNSDICNALYDYINATKSEVNLKDCSNLDGNSKDLCVSDNNLLITSKKTNVTYKHEEM